MGKAKGKRSPALLGAPPSFRMVARSVGEAVVVEMHGDLDLATAGLARAELAAVSSGKPRWLVVDLSNVGLLDSTGLAVLIDAAKQGGHGGEFALLCPGGLQVRGVLSLSGALDRFAVFDTEAELRRSMRSSAARTGRGGRQ